MALFVKEASCDYPLPAYSNSTITVTVYISGPLFASRCRHTNTMFSHRCTAYYQATATSAHDLIAQKNSRCRRIVRLGHWSGEISFSGGRPPDQELTARPEFETALEYRSQRRSQLYLRYPFWFQLKVACGVPWQSGRY